MGRKARRTKWRTLDIADEQSDSEESNETTGARLPKIYQQKSFHTKFPYSSQSTPRRRYQQDGAKSTRSSSTASETKITFNEDEYTRITTPRQDVLFKKGYLNKPKNYQSQTSTGTSTTSTGNSTGNGTPDHQSTDLEYESQFVFPNAFLDQNGIYYVNSYEPYPLMLYNPPTYYTEFSNCKTKRYSTDSLTESTSPNNEEATSQDMSGGVSDYSGHHQVYNMVYPGYYVNGVCPSQDAVTNETPPTIDQQTRRLKKRRRRKTSRSQTTANNNTENSSGYSEDESENESTKPVQMDNNVDAMKKTDDKIIELVVQEEKCNGEERLLPENKDNGVEKEKIECIEEAVPVPKEQQEEETDISPENPSKDEQESDCSSKAQQKYDLKPDAEEFVPRAFRTPEFPISPVQFIKIPPNFVPIPIVPFNSQNFNPAFMPPTGIPVNFIPPDPKMFPPPTTNFAEYIQPSPPVTVDQTTTEGRSSPNCQTYTVIENCDNVNTAKEDNVKIEQNVVNTPTLSTTHSSNKSLDIATVVSKLEKAVKEQNNENEETKKTNSDVANDNSKRHNGIVKTNRLNQKYRNNYHNRRNNYYNSVQNSPQRLDHKENGYHENGVSSYQNGYVSDTTARTNTAKDHNNMTNGYTTANENSQDNRKYIRNSPEKFKKSWKQQLYPNGVTNKIPPNGLHKDYRPKTNPKNNEENIKNRYNKHYSETVKQNSTNVIIDVEKKQLPLPVNGEVQNAINKTPESPKIVVLSNTESTPTKTSNQWISVSSRKKRKNKSMEENEAVSINDHDDQLSQSDQFESYDVNMLVDVVPPPLKEEVSAQEEVSIPVVEETLRVEITENKIVEDIINTLAQNEPKAIENISSISPEEMKTVLEIENELITKTEATVEVDKLILEDENVIEEDDSKIIKNKKKSRKGIQKPPTRKVIITDVDLSENCEEVIKTPVKKVVCKVSKTVDADTEEMKEQVKLNEDEEKKKSKKKKKKSIKTATVGTSNAISSPVLNSADDSYDFLLDTALVENTEHKTNDEISQEFDKIIQKGMYSSLEEKIKSLNIDESDGFFKSVFSKISNSRESSVEKMGYSTTGFTKTPDFTKILQSTTSRSMFKPTSVSEEIDLPNKPTNSLLLPNLDAASGDGFFLENPTVTDILHQLNGHQHNHNEEEKITEVGTINHSEIKNLYPITEAVKEWMCRTRETTPDVEILKSPATIYQEFCDGVSDNESESETEVINISKDDLSSVSIDEDGEEDEITLFVSDGVEKSRESSQDSQEYWEDDMTNSRETVINVSACKENVNMDAIEKGEDVIEVYESKYGKNEDFLNLQREIQAKSQRLGPARNSDLPHRAICCSIM